MKRFLIALGLLHSIAWAQAVVPPPPSSFTNEYLFYNKMHWAGAWNATATFSSQDLVSENNVGYISLQPLNVNHDPLTSPAWWVPLPSQNAPTPSDWLTLANSPFADTRRYNFSAQISTTLSAGNPATVTIAPCPAGLATPDMLYISGSSPEVVPLTSTTCTPGGTSGTITFTPANGHTAGSTIQSATFGVQEGANALGAAGGMVFTPAGSYTQFGQIVFPSNVHWVGAGEGSTIVQLSGANYTGNFGATVGWAVPNYDGAYSPVVFTDQAAGSSISSLTYDKNGASTAYTYGGIIAGHATSYVKLENLTLLNMSKAHLSSPVLMQGPTTHFYGRAITIINQPGCAIDGDGPGGFDVGGNYNQILDSYITNTCVAAYLPGNFGIVKGNTLVVGAGTMSITNQAYSADSTASNTFAANVCDGSGNSVSGPACFTVTTDDPTKSADHNVFTGNVARNCGQGYQIAPVFANSSTHANNTVITGGTVDGCATGIFIGDWVNYLTISDVAINNASLDGISTYTNGPSTSSNYVTIHDVTITNPATGIIFNTSSASTIPGIGYKLHHNTIIDNRSPHVMAIGIDFPRTLQYTGYEVTNNTVLGPLQPQNCIFLPDEFKTVAILQGNTTTDDTNQIEYFGGAIATAPVSVAIAAAQTDDIPIGSAGYLRLTSYGSPFSISGFDPTQPSLPPSLPADGQGLTVCNFTAQAMTLLNQTGSTAGHQISTGTGASVVVTHACAGFQYDATASYWMLK